MTRAATPAGGPSPFHAGELQVQERLGVREEMESLGARMYRPAIAPAHADFLASLPFIVAGSIDTRGGVWASVLAGPPGFLRVPDPRILEIAARPAAGDPLAESLRPGALLGCVGIDFAARRRARVNGVVESFQGEVIRLNVQQSFGNCPKYIQARSWRRPAPGGGPKGGGAGRGAERATGRATELDARAVESISRADTFFISSVAPGAPGESPASDNSRGLDASHRGGAPGFVKVVDARRLEFPDYVGNFLFNTLGNLAADPRAGLLFPDFDSGEALLLSGTIEILWDDPRAAELPGAQRLLRFDLRERVRLPGALPLDWSAPVMSPHLPGSPSP